MHDCFASASSRSKEQVNSDAKELSGRFCIMANTEMSRGSYPSSFNKALWVGKVINRQPSPHPESRTSEAHGLLGAAERDIDQTRRSRALVVLSVALSLSPIATAAKAQTVSFSSRFNSATGHLVLENPLDCGSIHLNLSQCGWTH
jgi:hypothetical protein